MTRLELWKEHLSPRNSVDEMLDVFNDLQRGFLLRSPNAHAALSELRSDVSEVEHAFLVNLDLPGVKKEDIAIDFQNGELRVSGEKRAEEELKTARLHRKERSFGKFERTFRFQEEINPDLIEASFENGVLKVALPKAEASKSKRIDIQESPKGFLRKLTGKAEQKSVSS
jgi:HSP20 family protein